MKSFTSATFLASLLSILSTTQAATVTLQTSQCLQHVELETFTITLNELQRGVNQTCGLTLISADGASLSSITCQAYRDADGTVLGSAVFNSTSPALIATNPVDEGSIRCNTTSAVNTTSSSAASSASSTLTGVTLITARTASGTGVGSTATSNTTSPSLTAAPSSVQTGAASALKPAAALVGLAGFVAWFL